MCLYIFGAFQNILNSEGGPGDSLSIMYGTLLQNYEAVKDDYNLLRRRYDDLAASHQSAVAKLEHSQNFQVSHQPLGLHLYCDRGTFSQTNFGGPL